ncbi:MAG: hybrid sensor histidine kinase/response regulator [Candidatus Parabeggiatoa sp.]|nr:hybrid sensor histidine kinase/response regulator [Candidatus Parabeggiatoa sp.]
MNEKEDKDILSDTEALFAEFAEDNDEPEAKDDDNSVSEEEMWKLLIVDDEDDVHQLTRFVLDDYVYQDKKLKLISAYSAEDAKVLLEQNPNIAVILLDVVMETNDAGLKLVEYIRENQQNHFVRIILRTGQAGYAPEKQVILKYDINDYKNKTELTDQKLFTVITASLRAYSDIITIESYRQHLEDKVAERTSELQEKNEALVKLNEQLIQINQEKNEFLGIAAHDLKNPLSSIQSLANLTRTSFDDFPKQKLIDFAQMIEISSNKMFNLIKNLLDVNAIESGKMNFSLTQLDVFPFLQVIVENNQGAANSKKIGLQVHREEEEYKAIIDENAILQVLDNLISNAIKYSSEGKNIDIRILKGENTVCCEIQDEGPGLSEKDQKQLFQKFSRLTPRPTGDEHSTGLGLFIVKKLIHIMNGSVSYKGKLGEGSTFVIEFPST